MFVESEKYPVPAGIQILTVCHKLIFTVIFFCKPKPFYLRFGKVVGWFTDRNFESPILVKDRFLS